MLIDNVNGGGAYDQYTLLIGLFKVNDCPQQFVVDMSKTEKPCQKQPVTISSF